MPDETTPNPYLISFLTVRRAIGFLGILLPAVMLAGTALRGPCHLMQQSISHYYYSSMGDVFVGILCAIGLFLIAYKGYDRTDNIATNIAGGLAFLIALFATDYDPTNACRIRSLPFSDLRNAVHLSSAVLFFLALAFISFFLFTKSGRKKEDLPPAKKRRNLLYRVCGIVIVVSILAIAVFHLGVLQDLLWKYHLIFWCEWVALLAFGTSWLVKGEVLLADN